MFADYVIRRP